MQLITHEITINGYLNIDIIDLYDDHSSATFKCNTTFSLSKINQGLKFDVYKVDNMHLTYIAEKYETDESINIDLDLSEYTKNINIDKSNYIDQSLFLADVKVNIIKKYIDLNFEF